MTRPLNRGIARALSKPRTIIIADGKVIVSARNSDFPKLSENIAARVMLGRGPQWQDIDQWAENYSPNISREVLK